MVEESLRKPENRWRSAKRWTEWEDALLKAHFPKEGILSLIHISEPTRH